MKINPGNIFTGTGNAAEKIGEAPKTRAGPGKPNKSVQIVDRKVLAKAPFKGTPEGLLSQLYTMLGGSEGIQSHIACLEDGSKDKTAFVELFFRLAVGHVASKSATTQVNADDGDFSDGIAEAMELGESAVLESRAKGTPGEPPVPEEASGESDDGR